MDTTFREEGSGKFGLGGGPPHNHRIWARMWLRFCSGEAPQHQHVRSFSKRANRPPLLPGASRLVWVSLAPRLLGSRVVGAKSSDDINGHLVRARRAKVPSLRIRGKWKMCGSSMRPRTIRGQAGRHPGIRRGFKFCGLVGSPSTSL